jgi:hypothetical protein
MGGFRSETIQYPPAPETHLEQLDSDEDRLRLVVLKYIDALSVGEGGDVERNEDGAPKGIGVVSAGRKRERVHWGRILWSGG